MRTQYHSSRLYSPLTQLARLVGALVAVLLCTPALAEQNAVQLTVKPSRCISLHQGQVCYQQVTFSWQTPPGGHFCLYVEHSQDALTCWRGADKTGYDHEFEARESTHFEIRSKGQGRVLGRVKVQVASVYKTSTRSHSRWRLF